MVIGMLASWSLNIGCLNWIRPPGPWRGFEPCGGQAVHWGEVIKGSQNTGKKYETGMHRKASQHRGRAERPVVNTHILDILDLKENILP